MLASVSYTSMGSRRSELIGYLVEGTQGEPVCPPSFLKFRVRLDEADGVSTGSIGD